MFRFCFNPSAKKIKGNWYESLPALDEQTEELRELRDLPPVHYLFKILNFSHLLNEKTPNFESSEFNVSGHRWRLRLSHNLKEGNNEKQYLSLYLHLSESNSLCVHEEMDVYFKLFVYNQVEDNYLTVQGRVRRFSGKKKEWGFDELLPLDVFKDESNGYLINDRCAFGAEIFVLYVTNNIRRKGESASVVKELGDNTFTWNIRNFEQMKKVKYKSEVFTIGGHKWSLLVYPNGDSDYTKGNYLSAYLRLEDTKADLNPGEKLKVEYVLRVRDQLRGEYHELPNKKYFSALAKAWGLSNFISLSKLNDTLKGYIMNGSVILQVQISLLAVVKEFSWYS